MSFTFYHNPRCRKSREALSILEEHTDDIEIVEYLKEPPSEVELKRIIGLLGIDAIELVRKGEDDFKINFKGQDLPEGEWIVAGVKETNGSVSWVELVLIQSESNKIKGIPLDFTFS